MNGKPELEWFKSSYSSSNNINDCVEVAWRKSSYSDSGDVNDCVEVGTTPTAVLVRDSKDTARPHVSFGAAAWVGFIAYTG
ncbi:DUF397 domain-containing protein [Streptomyces sp. NPDC086989]|uniref:DUF397 domain-containing protein n=1 Tax=Streptomyces sp. NPDC086989 TaxID=3365764 RepID=UPI00381209AD